MINDRLGELRGGGGGGSGSFTDLEAGGSGGAAPFMEAFFEEVQEIKKSMSSIRSNIRQIEQSHGECLTAISAEASRASTEQLEGLMKQTNGLAQSVRNKLKGMDQENKDFARTHQGASEARIRSNMHSTLTRKFVDLMAEYQEIQTKYKGKYRERVERQYKIVKPHATREEIDNAFDGSDGQQPEIFTQQILQGPGHAAARTALADIQERHKDITRLETSIQELHQLFLDMSVLVETQGELLDQIEYTVSQSVNYTGKAVEELRTASKYQKAVRKKMCCLICIILIIIAIVVVPIVVDRIGSNDQKNGNNPNDPNANQQSGRMLMQLLHAEVPASNPLPLDQ
jgi:syntaxin 1B/2/3